MGGNVQRPSCGRSLGEASVSHLGPQINVSDKLAWSISREDLLPSILCERQIVRFVLMSHRSQVLLSPEEQVVITFRVVAPRLVEDRDVFRFNDHPCIVRIWNLT